MSPFAFSFDQFPKPNEVKCHKTYRSKYYYYYYIVLYCGGGSEHMHMNTLRLIVDVNLSTYLRLLSHICTHKHTLIHAPVHIDCGGKSSEVTFPWTPQQYGIKPSPSFDWCANALSHRYCLSST